MIIPDEQRRSSATCTLRAITASAVTALALVGLTPWQMDVWHAARRRHSVRRVTLRTLRKAPAVMLAFGMVVLALAVFVAMYALIDLCDRV